MPLIARQRSRLAVLAVLALVGSLLAVSAVPAVAAADDTADATAEHSACVGAATEDAGFSDMGNSFAADAANCLAHYGISTGSGDGSTFAPEKAVTRLQMARFLSRAAGPAGIDTMGVEAQGLPDISDLGEEAQHAVNTVASLGIMTARSDDTFDPAGTVSRRDMAVHLAAFLSNALVGPGGVDIDDLKDDLESGASPFTDIGEVSVSAHKAIRDIFELGVTTGTTDTTFSPENPVSRAQMAAFITRALAHTNARPAGITAQGPSTAFVEAPSGTGDGGGSVNLSVSIRDDMHAAVPDASIDVISTSTPDEAFDDAGECVTDELTSGDDCKITATDEATDPDGNATASVTLAGSAGTTTAWVWTGDTDDAFDADTTDSAMVEIDRVLEATQTLVTEDMKKNAKFLKFGDTVTYTLQVADTNGDPVSKADAAVTATATIVTLDANGSVSDTADTSRTVTTHMTDASGRIEISFTQDDPTAGSEDRGDRIRLTLALGGETHTLDESKVNDRDAAAGIQVIWSDAKSSIAESAVDANDGGTLTVSSVVSYHEVEDGGSAVGNAMMATLVDQYGDPVRGHKIGIWSTGATASSITGSAPDNAATAPVDQRTTDRNGVATKRYTLALPTGETGATELLQARYVTVTGCRDTEASCDETDDVITITDDDVDEVSHWWATKVSAASSADVLAVDTDNNTVVLAGPLLVTYKAGDYFEESAAGAQSGITMDAFEKALEAGDTLTVVTNTTSGISTFTIG